MATTTERHLAQIARLIGDPRYLNKKHPEHLRIFAEATRAFEDAYPEPPPESDTTEGNVHVRAYTRIVDGKEVQVSAYDRTQQIAMRGLPPPDMGRREDVEDVISNNPFHDHIQYYFAAALRASGARVATDLRVRDPKTGKAAWPDIVVELPNGCRFVVEVKTGEDPTLTEQQRRVYPQMMRGNRVYADSGRWAELGYEPGTMLPAMPVLILYVRNRQSVPELFPLTLSLADWITI